MRCAHCKQRYVPRLCAMLGVMTTFYRPTAGVSETCIEQFEYLSMLVIRKELINLSQKIPLTMLSMAELREMNPRIYWNIVVKMLSLLCPLDFLDLPDMTEKPANAASVTAQDNDVERSSLEKAAQGPVNEVAAAAHKELRGGDMGILLQEFSRTLRSIRATQGGSKESWERTKARSLACLDECARTEEEDLDTESIATRDVSSAFSSLVVCREQKRGNEDTDERRSCRTLSCTDSNGGTAAADDDDPAEDADAIASDDECNSVAPLPERMENEFTDASGSNHRGSAPFRCKSRNFSCAREKVTFEAWRTSENRECASSRPPDTGQRVVWNKTTAAFELQSRVPHHQAPLFTARRYAKEPTAVYQQPVRSDASLPPNVLDELDLGIMQHAEWSLEHFRAARIQVYDQILAAASPLVLLLQFVAKWRTTLLVCKEHVVTNQTGAAQTNLVCQEFLELAQAFKSLGEVADARAALGQCIALARQLLLLDNGRDRLLQDAKRELLTCIHFQEAFTSCELLLHRQKTPPSILAHLQRQIDQLVGQALFSVKTWTIKTRLHLKANQFPTVVSDLSSSPLTAADEFLAMAHARALEMVGAYTQSLAAAQAFLASEHGAQRRDASATKTKLCAHAKRLELVLERKRQAEQLECEEKNRDAEKCYGECLELVGRSSNNCFTAELLYRRANLVMMDMATSVDRLTVAIQDLTLNCQLWPANQLATLCLEIAQLRLETEKLKRRMRKRE